MNQQVLKTHSLVIDSAYFHLCIKYGCQIMTIISVHFQYAHYFPNTREDRAWCKDETKIVPLNIKFTTTILLVSSLMKKRGNTAVIKITFRNPCASIHLIIASCVISSISCELVTPIKSHAIRYLRVIYRKFLLRISNPDWA